MRKLRAGFLGAVVFTLAAVLGCILLGALWGIGQVLLHPGPNERSEIALGWVLGHAIEWSWHVGVWASLVAAPLGWWVGIAGETAAAEAQEP